MPYAMCPRFCSAQLSTFPHSYTFLPPGSCLLAPSFSLSQCESSFLCLFPSLSPSTTLFALPFLDSRRLWVHPETHGGQADTFIAIVAHTLTQTVSHLIIPCLIFASSSLLSEWTGIRPSVSKGGEFRYYIEPLTTLKSYRFRVLIIIIDHLSE